MTDALLTVRDLRVDVVTADSAVRVVDGVSLTVDRGEVVGLVGESGCGKSMTAASILQLFATPQIRIAGGEIELAGTGRLDGMSDHELRAVRGAQVGMVFQDPSTFLDPVMSVGAHVGESIRCHTGKKPPPERIHELLRQMGLPDVESLARRYPHQLSGGQRQRVLIAAALAMNPSLLIADEPSTALDVTVQAALLRLVRRLCDAMSLGVLFITHDLGVIAELCDRVYVMYAGKVVEARRIEELFADPRHPYTQGLLHAARTTDGGALDLFAIPGTVPELHRMPSGCRFHPRCPVALPVCEEETPADVPVGAGHAACWRATGSDTTQAWQVVHDG